MLLTSAGFLKVDAQTITLPKGDKAEKVTVTVTGKGLAATIYPILYKGISGEEKVSPKSAVAGSVVYEFALGEAVQSYHFNNDYLAAWGEIGLTLDGKISSFIASTGSDVLAPHYSSLTFSNNGALSELNVAQATNLKTLDASSNKLTAINVQGATKLETLNVANNEITDLGMLPASLLDLNIANNKFAPNGEWNLSTDLPKLTKLNIDGNKITSVKVPATCTDANFIKGIQDFTEDITYGSSKEIRANVNLDITEVAKVCVDPNITDITSATEWKKLKEGTEDTYDHTEEAQHYSTNAENYRFYDAQKVYQSGKYECVLVKKDGFKYRVRLNIAPAVFTIERATLAHNAKIVAYNASNSPVFSDDTNTAQVQQGEELVVGVDFTNATKYELVQFTDVKGLELKSGESWTKNNVACKVVGKFISAEKDETPYINAEIKGANYKVTFTTPDASKGFIEVYKKDADGNYKETITSGTELPYGTLLKIVVTAKEPNVEPKLAINGENVVLTKEGGQYVKVDYKIEKEVIMTPSFEPESSIINVTAFVNEGKISSSTVPSFITVRRGDKEFQLKDQNDTAPFTIGQDYQITFDVPNDYEFVNMLVGGKEVKMEPTLESDRITYRGTFTVPATNADIYITVNPLTKVEIVPSKGKEQIATYDGKPHAFEFTTKPSGLENNMEVTYTLNKSTSTTPPTEAGTYTVTVKGKQGSGYAAVNEDFSLQIKQAVPTFTKLPTVTFADGKYTCTGELKGKYEVKAVAGADVTKSHLVEVTFTPEDSKNYTIATFTTEAIVDGKSIDKMPVTVVVENKELSVTVLNGGSVPVGLSGKYLKGTKLTILVTYPENVTADDVTVTEAIVKANALTYDTDKHNASERIKAYTYTVPEGTAGEELHVSVTNVEAKYSYVVTIPEKEEVYAGKPLTGYTEEEIVIEKANNDPNDSYVEPEYVISYVGVNGLPVNVGEYDVRIQIKAGNGYAAFDQIFKGKYKVVQATPTVKEWPTARPISIGQTLRYASFEGGAVSGVPGHFEWDNLDYVPKTNQEKCKVVFIPVDQVNYKTVDSGTENGVPVTVINQRLVTYYTNFPGQTDITVKDKSGKYYESGDPVAKGTVLSITTATINNDLELASLSVAGATKNSDGTYTVGDSSIEISATFQVKTKPGNFKVTVPEYLRGTIITGGGEHVVAEGGTLSFTVATASADASKVSVKASNGTVTKGSNGRYTLSGLTANSTVTVSLSNPTALKVDIQKSYLNAGKYHVATVEVESDYTDGKFYYGDEITVVAYPESGVKFEKWSDGSKDQVHDIVLTGDLKLTATFSGTPTGIEDIMAASIATGKGCVWVRGIANADVTIVSIAGRVQARQRISGDTRIDVPAGIYVVVLESGSDVKRVKVIVK